MIPSVRNLLVFRFGQIGDTIASLPSLWVLRRQFPLARIVILSDIPPRKTRQPPESILPPAGLVDAFVKYPGGASAKHFFAAWRQDPAIAPAGIRHDGLFDAEQPDQTTAVARPAFFPALRHQTFAGVQGIRRGPAPQIARWNIGNTAEGSRCPAGAVEAGWISGPGRGTGLHGFGDNRRGTGTGRELVAAKGRSATAFPLGGGLSRGKGNIEVVAVGTLCRRQCSC